MTVEVSSTDASSADEPTSATQATNESSTRPDDAPAEAGAGQRRWRIVRRAVVWSLVLSLVGGGAWAVHHELTTSELQAEFFADLAARVNWRLEDGPSDAARFPTHGPYDERLGYTRLPEIVERLGRRGFEVARQARVSSKGLELFDEGLSLPYAAANQAGLEIVDTRDNLIHRSVYPTRVYADFDAVPALVAQTLLHIENRSLLDPKAPQFNPALEWKRFAHAVGEVAYREAGGDVDPDGASTLATQIEKYRHSPGGRTGSYHEKLRQMLSASLAAYRDGQETLGAQRDIVLTYVNSVPLSAVVGFGEVLGVGDGLYAWYGEDFERASKLLREASASGTDPDAADAPEQARVFRRVLSLFVAQRRPSYYLVDDRGRAELDQMTDFYLRDLARHGIISPGFRDLALAAQTGPWRDYVDEDDGPFWTRKLAHSLRVGLLGLTGAPSLYALDRYDVRVKATVDQDVQHAVETTLQRMADPKFLADKGLDRYRLLDRGDPSKVIYSFTLYERTADTNVLRVQADTVDGPFNINEGMKLNLGSTAKLRTLASYLDVVATLHDELAGLTRRQLADVEVHWSNHLKRWAVAYLRRRDEGERGLQAMLDAAMERRYSANPRERFFTGGGIQRFSNFSYKYNNTSPTVHFALEHSINLVFVRMMRDIVRFYMFRQQDTGPEILNDRDDPRRRRYLERFADYEGKVFLRDFYRRYRDDTPRQRMVRFLSARRWTPKRFVTAYRAIRPHDDVYTVRALLDQQLDGDYDIDHVRGWFDAYGPEHFDLNDQGYVSRVHPLELWLLNYLQAHPKASWPEVRDASKEVRQEVYEWLFETSRKHAQDQRIRVMMEQDAFEPIHREWKRLGYPFDELVPSYATAIGSSSDRPQALATLMGIIVNDGMRLPQVRFTKLAFAVGTPYETQFERAPATPQRVMPREVARTLRRALTGVVERGTAHRLNDYDLSVDGRELVAGGKTGTGDNRYKVVNRHGRVLRSIARNRTATFVFYLGARFFGAVTAYVPGQQADDYDFTSGLAVSVLGILAPKLAPLWERADPDTSVSALEPRTPSDPGHPQVN